MLCQLSYRGSVPRAHISKVGIGAMKSGTAAEQVRPARARRGRPRGPRSAAAGRPGRRGRCPRRTRRATDTAGPRGAPAGRSRARRAVPRAGTCRCSTTLAVTRSRTSSSSRPGSSIVSTCSGRALAPGADLADPQHRGVAVPVGGLDLLPRDPRRTRAGSSASRVPADRRRRRSSAQASSRSPAATSIGGRVAVPHAQPHWAAHGALAQLAAVLLERGQLAEHPVVLRRRARPGWCAAAAT